MLLNRFLTVLLLALISITTAAPIPNNATGNDYVKTHGRPPYGPDADPVAHQQGKAVEQDSAGSQSRLVKRLLSSSISLPRQPSTWSLKSSLPRLSSILSSSSDSSRGPRKSVLTSPLRKFRDSRQASKEKARLDDAKRRKAADESTRQAAIDYERRRKLQEANRAWRTGGPEQGPAGTQFVKQRPPTPPSRAFQGASAPPILKAAQVQQGPANYNQYGPQTPGAFPGAVGNSPF